MKRPDVVSVIVALLACGLITAATTNKRSDPQPFTIDLSEGVPRLLALVNQTQLPAYEEYPNVDASLGINLGVLKSLQRFAFSSAPPANWTIGDTARVFNTLMTQVLGYNTYAVHGTDWGSVIAYRLYNDFNGTARALHETIIPFLPATMEALAAGNITLTANQVFTEQRSEAWLTNGQGYFLEQTTRPNTIGLALYDNPVGQLAWLAESYIEWSDPRAGTEPSVLTHNQILLVNPGGLSPNYTKANTDAPLLFSSFKYNLAFWPPPLIERVGNLVYYKYHDFGGHWAGLDNPPALVSDLREIATYWSG